MITLKKRKHIRWNPVDEARCRPHVVRERDPGQTTGRKIVGAGASLVDAPAFEKPMKSGFSGGAGRVRILALLRAPGDPGSGKVESSRSNLRRHGILMSSSL
jgi:hypothetical protein